MNIRLRLLLFYSLLFVLSTVASTSVYQQIYRNNLTESVRSSSMQTLQSISNQLEKELHTINNYSKIILSDSSIQSYLRYGNGGSRILYQRNAEWFLHELMNNFLEISSIYLIDLEGNKLLSDRLTDLEANERALVNFTDSANWYKEVNDLKGGSTFTVNGDDFFYNHPDEQVISCMRIVNDLDTQLPIGLLVINVEESFLIDVYEDVVSQYGGVSVFFIQDKNGGVYIGGEEMDTDFYKEGESFHVNQHQIDRFNVTITSVTEMVALDKGYSQLNYMAIAMVLFNGLILFVGSAIMASRITRPIEKLTGVMSKYHKSKENHVFLDSNYPEFKQLQDGYNRMMVDIAGLFDALGKEQKVKRKAELRALQAQIKPHFLYNTFDSVCALALMEDHNRVYEIMSSLGGQFYKLSLSKGNEVINLKEELEMVRHYLLIQKKLGTPPSYSIMNVVLMSLLLISQC